MGIDPTRTRPAPFPINADAIPMKPESFLFLFALLVSSLFPAEGWAAGPASGEDVDRLYAEASSLPMIFPADHWVTVRPETVGVDPDGLESALSTWRDQLGEDGLDEVVMIRRGHLFHRGPEATVRHNIWSATKSFTSTVLGLLIDDGAVTLETRAATIEPLLAADYPDVTLRQFTTMTSGYNAIGLNRWGSDSEDWSSSPFVPGPPLFPPGTAFAYWDEAQMMFARVLTRAANRDLFEILQERILEPIGVTEIEWWYEERLDGIPLRNGCTGIELNALDLARFGHLFLNRGKWADMELISSEWIESATRPQVPIDLPLADTDRKNADGRGVYGFNWLTNTAEPSAVRRMPDMPLGAYYAAGLNHNICLVIPEWDMVIVRTGTDRNPSIGTPGALNEMIRALTPAVSPLSAP